MTTVIENIGELITLSPLVGKAPGPVSEADLGRVRRAWLALENGKVKAFGEAGKGGGAPGPITARIDARGGLLMPGLVDSHAHLVFAGSRAGEMAMRLGGATYQEIAANGGGIRSTVTATRGARDDELQLLASARCGRMLTLGVTTLEAKSGYGLSPAEELRHLRILKKVQGGTPQTIRTTCLALHAASPETPGLAAYARQCAEELLPIVAREGLAQWVDAFIEQGYFSVADCEPYVARAQELGLGVRIHADEFSDSGAAAAAARWGAASADHLQFASEEGLKAMAAKGVTATVLPGTSLYTKIPFANARRMADLGCAVAIATDFNPGSCQLDNLAELAGIAAVQGGLRPWEAIAGVTYVPARSLGLGTQKGALAPGFDADFVLYHGLPSADHWLADFGRTLPHTVWIRGTRYL